MNKPLRLRPTIEAIENQVLVPYACRASESKGRDYRETEDTQRTVFQRDRDRIIHSAAFRRLRGKTQVFVAHHGDHFRNRLTHTMEVAQLARDFSRNLGLNEDLAEAIALAHDIGHTPFGHAGQQAMRELLHRYGLYFEHNQQSRRIVELLERKSPRYPGLNLTFEVRDGLMKHRKADYENSDLTDNGSLEAQVVDPLDHLYQNHDIEDGLRAGIIHLEELEKLELWKKATEMTLKKESYALTHWEIISSLIKLMANDLLNETARRLEALQPKTVDDIRNAKHPMVSLSREFEMNNDSLRHFLHLKLYRQPEVIRMSEAGQQVIKQIFFHLMKNPNDLPARYFDMIEAGESPQIVIKDFIAGMTDRYAFDFAAGLT